MKKTKIILDIIMTLFMIILMKMNITGMYLHELLGIIAFILFFIHKGLNFKFIKAIGKNILNSKLKTKSKVMFVLDAILLLFMSATIITGVLISKFILTSITYTNLNPLWHKFFAWWTLILISIHIGLHLDKVVIFFKEKDEFFKDNKTLKIIIITLYLAISIFGIMSLCKYSIYTKIIPFTDKGKITHQNTYNEETKYKNRRYNKKINDNTNETLSTNEIKDKKSPTLDEYLSMFNCGECGQNCLLSSPNCEIGMVKREEKEREYYQKYSMEKEKSSNQYNEYTKDNITNNKKGYKIQNQRRNKNKSNILDIINIICLFAGGTYFISNIENIKRKN